jgi:hypothetical protein
MSDVISPGPPEPELVDDPFVGTKYSVIRRLVSSAVTEVFLVLHAELGRPFISKVLRERFAADPQLLDRLRIEAQCMARLAHPQIVAVVDFGVTPEQRPFVVIDLRQDPDAPFKSATQYRRLLQQLLEPMTALNAADLATDQYAVDVGRLAVASPRQADAANSEPDSSGLLPLPMSGPNLLELLLFVAVAGLTAIGASQLVRVILVH